MAFGLSIATSHCSVARPSTLPRVIGTPKKMPLRHLVAWLKPCRGPSSCWHLVGVDWQCWPRSSWSPGLKGQHTGWGWEQGLFGLIWPQAFNLSLGHTCPKRLLAAHHTLPAQSPRRHSESCGRNAWWVRGWWDGVLVLWSHGRLGLGWQRLGSGSALLGTAPGPAWPLAQPHSLSPASGASAMPAADVCRPLLQILSNARLFLENLIK